MNIKGIDKSIKTVLIETVSNAGFIGQLRENNVDRVGFNKLCEALRELAEHYRSSPEISKILAAALFEVPWEIENTVDHYAEQDEELGREVSSMADTIRELIGELLWGGIDYQKYLDEDDQ